MFEQTDTNQTSSRKLTPTPIKILHVTNKLFQINGKDELFNKACQDQPSREKKMYPHFTSYSKIPNVAKM